MILFNLMRHRLNLRNDSYLLIVVSVPQRDVVPLRCISNASPLSNSARKVWSYLSTFHEYSSWWKPTLSALWWCVKVLLTHQAIALQLAPEIFHGCSFNLVLDILRQLFFLPPLVDIAMGNISIIYQKYKIVMNSKWS